MSHQMIPTRLLLLLTVFLSAVASGLVAVSAIDSDPQQPQPVEKTVEQVQKNIQVLKGLPESKLTPVMNFISASLGVRCNFCHVNNNGQWDFASDEKPEKKAAREMITMVLGLNKNSFNGNTDVSCYTCHRGRSRPQGSPELPIPPVTPRPASSEAAAAEKPPTADQVLARYLEALGGAAALDKVKTRALKGTFLVSNGATLGYELYQSAPNKVLAVLTTPQGVIERAFDGSVAWEKSPKGVRDMIDEESFYLKRYPDLFKDIKLKDQFSRLSFSGKEKLDERDVYVLRGTSAGNVRERLYFDVQTGLLVRRVTVIGTAIGNIPEQVDFVDYRDVDGLKMPFTIRISSIDPYYTSTRKFTEIKLNVPVDEKRFSKPAGGQ
jgi:photosynthetic reaction center cytochrome c subunit